MGLGSFFDDVLGFDDSGGLGGFADDVLGIDDSGGIVGSIKDNPLAIIFPFTGLGLYGALRPEVPSIDAAVARVEGTLLTRSGAVVSIPVIYGAVRTGGALVFEAVTGATNEYLHQIYVWADGEIEAIDAVYIDDVISSDAKYSGLVRVKHYTGADGQTADTDLVAEVSAWTSAHRGRGIAYTYLRLKWESNVWRGRPKVQADVRGRKIYDPRSSTTVYSNNPALCIRDYLINTRYGLGADAADVDDSAIIDAANYCETQREKYNGAGVWRNLYACDGFIDTARSVRDNITELLTCCRGYLAPTAGKFTLLLDQPRSATFTFTVDNIVGEWSIDCGGKRDRLNRVEATFANAAKDYKADLATEDSPTFRSADAGLLLDRRLSLPCTTDYYRARDLCELEMKQSRQGLVVSFTATLAALVCRVGDVVNITHATPGWTEKKFLIMAMDLANDGSVRITAREYEATVYDLTLPTERATPADTSLPDPTVVLPPSGLVLDGGTAALLPLGDGTNLARIKCSITASSDIYAIGYQFEFKESAAPAWAVGAVTQSRTGTEAYLFPVRDLVAYDVRVCTINSMGYKSPYITQLNYTVLGEEEPPSNVASAWIEIDGDRARIKWSQVADVDVNEYEVRRGTSWETATFVFRGNADNTLLTALPVGLNTYLVKAIDRRKKYSTTAAVATFTTVAPAVGTPIAQVIDNNVLLKWTATPGSLPIRRYNVRRGASFASPDRDFGAVDSTFAVVFEDASGSYTYWVQPVDAAENAGAAVPVTAAVSQPPDYVLRSDQNSVFAGTKTNAVALASGALLLPVNTADTWTQHFNNNAWSNIQAQITAGYPIYAEPSTASGSYQEVIDYGTTLPATKITITPTTTQIHGTNTLTPTLETAPDNAGVPGTWTSYGNVWEAFAAGGFRFVRVTVATTSSGGDDLIRIDVLNVRASLKLKSDAGMGTANAVDSGGTTVTFNESFLDVSSITVTPSGTAARYAIYDFVDAPNPTTFKVLLFDSAGARVTGGFSWTARGN